VVRAAVIDAYGQDKAEIRDDVEAIAPAPGHVKVRMRSTGVCHSDLSAMAGILPAALPAVLGHEGAGEVLEVGEGVTRVKPGDRIVVAWVPPCGSCKTCLRGEPNLCMELTMAAYGSPNFSVGGNGFFGMAGTGTFAEEMTIPQAGCIPLADDVPFEIGALIGCGVMTGVGAALNTAKVRPGSSVAVIGCGGVGISAIQGARLSGASLIVAVDTVPDKLEVARRFGATHAVTPDRLSDLVTEITGGEGFDYAFDVVALPQTLRTAWTAARRGGTVVVVGAGRAEHQVEFNPFELLFEGTRIIPSLYGSAYPPRDFPRLIALWRAGRLDLEGMVSHRLRLDQIDDALAALGRGDVIRQVIINDASA
jgi:S-(hydroxymethyl)glutathione dehydrogenase/alcohol dehydrogenase